MAEQPFRATWLLKAVLLARELTRRAVHHECKLASCSADSGAHLAYQTVKWIFDVIWILGRLEALP